MNYARARSREVVAQLRRQRPVTPQGNAGLNDAETVFRSCGARAALDHTCKRCGYIQCNCRSFDDEFDFVGPKMVVDARVPRGIWVARPMDLELVVPF